MLNNLVRIWRLAVCAALLVGIAGCDEAPPQSAATTPPPAAADSPAGDVCGVVPVAVLNSMFGISEPGRAQLGPGGSSCHWANQATSTSVTLTVGAAGSASGGKLPSATPGQEYTATQIPNVEARRTDGGGEARFVAGDQVCTLEVASASPDGVDQATAVRLVQGLYAAIVAGLKQRTARPEQAPAPEEQADDDGLVTVVFELAGSGPVDNVVIDFGPEQMLNDQQLPFRQERRVASDINLLQLHVGGSKGENLSCKITRDGEVVVTGGRDCVFNPNAPR